eukprot:1960555-Amphidinium_carterae.1
MAPGSPPCHRDTRESLMSNGVSVLCVPCCVFRSPDFVSSLQQFPQNGAQKRKYRPGFLAKVSSPWAEEAAQASRVTAEP